MLKKTDWQKLILALGLMAASAAILFCYFYFGQNTEMTWLAGPNKDGMLKLPKYTHRSKLNGVGVLRAEDETPKVVGIMLDGHFDALPLKGVNEAAIIYEAPMEGVTTRFLAIYPAGQNVSEVGPVRSARPYFLDWLAEYGDALYMHCGGSPEALDLIKERKIFDANEFYWGSYYWRDHSRTAPYNLFTTAEKWNLILDKYGEKHPGWSWEGWQFSFEPAAATSSEPVKEIKIRYGRGFEVVWKYNAENRKYERWLNGEKMLEGDSAIAADNILVQYASMITLDEIGRRKIETIGEGEARIFQNGEMLRGTWKKDGRPERTRFYNKDGTEVKLIPGKIWIMTVPENLAIEISI